MAEPWERQQGEPLDLFERFEQFLALGPRRTTTELARRIGVTSQSIGQSAKRYGWRQRAAAWDEKHEDVSYAARSKSAMPPPPKPPPKVVVPEVLGVIAPADKEDQITEGRLFRDAYRAKGKALLTFSNQIQETAEVSHQDLSLTWKLRMEALDRQDFQAAESFCKQIVQLTPCFWKVVDATLNTARHGHDYWGNSAALFELINEAYGGKG